MTRYEIHFRSTIRKLKGTTPMLKAMGILEACHLTEEHKEDLWAIWWHRKQKGLGWL